jgi:hypothetical protein
MTDSWLRQARTWRALTASGARLRTLAAGSRVVSVLAPPVQRLRGAVTDDGDQPGESEETATVEALSSPAVSGSYLLGWLGRLRGSLGRAQRGARVSRAVAGGRVYVKESFLYRWLTAEPEPDVVVIDLRETLTVGPWLRGLERATRWLLPAALSSRLFRAGGWITRVVRARPLQVLGGLLVGLATLLVGVTGLTGGPSGPVVLVALVFAIVGWLGTRVDLSLATLRETRAYQLLAAAFAPPEPPASSPDNTTQDRTDTADTPESDRAESNRDERDRNRTETDVDEQR